MYNKVTWFTRILQILFVFTDIGNLKDFLYLCIIYKKKIILFCLCIGYNRAKSPHILGA